MKQQTITYYVICHKGDHTRIVHEILFTDERKVKTTGDIDIAYTTRTKEHLFELLEEYESYFEDDYEVVGIDETITREYKSFPVSRACKYV